MRALELAQSANSTAASALAKIEGHERLCNERWAQVAATLGEVKAGVNGLYSRLWSVVGALIVLLLGVIGSLLARHGI